MNVARMISPRRSFSSRVGPPGFADSFQMFHAVGRWGRVEGLGFRVLGFKVQGGSFE